MTKAQAQEILQRYKTAYPEVVAVWQDPRYFMERRRRARRQQRLAIALCLIGSVILLAMEFL